MTGLARSVAVPVAPIAATTMLTGTLAALGAPLPLGAALAWATTWRSGAPTAACRCPEGEAGQRRSLGSRVGSAYMRGQPRPAAPGRSS